MSSNYSKKKSTPSPLKNLTKFPKFSTKSTPVKTIDHDPLVSGKQAEEFFEHVLINASTVASHDAFDLMEPTNSLKDKLSVDFVKVSPCRPFGFYVFCTQGEDLAPSTPRQQLVVENPNDVLQLLFYFLQLPNEDQDLAQFALQSLTENFGYEKELNKNGLQLEKIVDIKQLNKHLSTSNGTTDDLVPTSNKALLDLAKIWDVIVEMVRREDLPDDFEVWGELVDLGTRFRRVYEPLDIANYYRHSKGEDTGSRYME
ncbi:putative EDS1, EP domain-containing protein [Helianthus annuus]|nr:putative EDS1, EP domain-containing protein [Helianthus annuus]KAJ0748218.1 putative EDS1, EP domain-containing protein [Helianthus annuus]